MRFSRRRRHRLFGNDVAARFQATHDVAIMIRINGGDDDGMRPRFAQHAIEAVRGVGARLGRARLTRAGLRER